MQAVLPEIAERDGAPRVALEAARHLSMCPSCAAKLLRLRHVNGLLDRLPAPEIPPSFTTRVIRALPKRVRSGAGLVLLLAVAWQVASPSRAGSPASFLETLADPWAAAGSVVLALVGAALGLLGVLRSAFEGVSTASWGIRGITSPLSVPVVILVPLAAAGLAASVAAFGHGALRLRHSRRKSLPDLDKSLI